MTTMGMVDASDLLMIIRGVMNVSSRSPKVEWASPTHTTPDIAKKISKANKRTNLFDTLSIEYAQQTFTHASDIFHRMWSNQVSKSA